MRGQEITGPYSGLRQKIVVSNDSLAGAAKRSARSMLNSPVSEQDRMETTELKPI